MTANPKLLIIRGNKYYVGNYQQASESHNRGNLVPSLVPAAGLGHGLYLACRVGSSHQGGRWLAGNLHVRPSQDPALCFENQLYPQALDLVMTPFPIRLPPEDVIF